MRRRRRNGLPKTMLGPWFDKVHMKINENMKREVAMFAPFPLDNSTMIDHCVDSHVLKTLVEAKNYKEGYDSSYGNVMWEFDTGVNLIGAHRGYFSVDFDAVGSLVPKANLIEPDTWLMTQLRPWSEQFIAIYRKWSVVYHVAQWFDTNSSITACRYYWPVMMALLPPSPKLQELHEAAVGSHQKEPKGIGSILPLARETATYVTAGQLLPDRDPAATGNKVKLNIRGSTFPYQDHNENTHKINSVDLTFDL